MNLKGLKRLANGELVYRPAWMGYYKKARPIRTWTARVDSDPAKTMERAVKSIEKSYSKLESYDRERIPTDQKYGSFYLRASDGYRGLMLPWKEDMQDKVGPNQGLFDVPRNSLLLDDPELFLAVKRAQVIADGDSHLIKFIIGNDRLTVTAECDGSTDPCTQGSTFSQSFMLSEHADETTIGLNSSYVLDCLGTWPVWFHWSAKFAWEAPVMFRPKDDSWRYCVMPIKL